MPSAPTDAQARTARLLDVIRDAHPRIVAENERLIVEYFADEDTWDADETFAAFDQAKAEAADRIIDEALEAAGFDPTDPDLMDRVYELRMDLDFEVDRAERYEAERRDREIVDRYDVGPPADYELLDDPVARRTWERVYRPRRPGRDRRPPASLQSHGARHRRAPSRRPVRRVGSRRSASSGDPDDGESPPPAPASGAERQAQLAEATRGDRRLTHGGRRR